MPIIVKKTVHPYPSHTIEYMVLAKDATVYVTVAPVGHTDQLRVTDARLSPAEDRYPKELVASAIQAARQAVERQLAEDAKPGATRRQAMAMTSAGVVKLPREG